jgi:hypothetical protein
MTPAGLLSSIDRMDRGRLTSRKNPSNDLGELKEPTVREQLTMLAQLPDSARDGLWPELTGWELTDGAFRVYCPHCCLQDLQSGRTPYGRRCWQQSWCTVCQRHGVALVLRRPARQVTECADGWSIQGLKSETIYLAPDRYRQLKVKREPELRRFILGSLLEIERAVSRALLGVHPNSLLWGPLTAKEFLGVLSDLTTWALTHFEPVRTWSIAEDLSPAEEQEGYGLIGRGRRLTAADYPAGDCERRLQELGHPKIRASALWVAHSLMSASHSGASDRTGRDSPQERQALRVLPSSAARSWLATRQQGWPDPYRRRWWIDLKPS